MVALFSALLNPAVAQASSKEAPAPLPLNLRTVPEVPVPQSVFSIPNPPSEGRNPFFPQSTLRPVAPKVDNATPIETFSFILNGITSPPRRTAMINGRTFEPAEEGEVKLPSGGKMLIKVEEIKADSAIILVSGQRRELRLRSGL